MALAHDALLVADGDVDMALLTELSMAPDRPLLIAADGGAAQVLEAGLVPDIAVGDFDSLRDEERARLEELGVDLRLAAPDKDESDLELGLLAARDAGVERITILGALGLVRPEHSVANLLLLADPRLDGLDVRLAGRGSRIWRIGTVDGPGEATVDGAAGDFVSLFPLGGSAEGVTTEGLRFGLRDESLPLGPSRGLSNELTASRAKVTVRRGCLLVIHTHRSMSDASPAGGT
jgi:thiamine pyrophosphokinase